MRIKESLVLLGMVPSLLLGNTIPDEINKEKYKQIYLEAKRESDEQRLKADRLKNQAVRTDVTIRQKQQQLKDREERVISIAEETEENLRANEQLRQEIIQLEIEIEKLTKSISALEGENATLDEKREENQVILQEEQAIYDNIAANLRQVRTRYEATVANLNAKLSQIQKLEEDNRSIMSQMASIRHQRAQSSTELVGLRSEKSDLEHKTAILSESLRDYARLQRELSQIIADLEPRVETALRDRDHYHLQWQEHLGKLEKVTQRLQNIKLKLQELRQTIPQLNQQIRELQRRLIVAQEKRNNWQIQLTAYQNEQTGIQGQLVQVENRLNNINRQMRPLVRKINNLTKEKQGVERELKRLQSRPQNHPAVKAKVQEYRGNIQRIEGEIALLQRDLKPLQGEINRLTKEIKALQGKVSADEATFKQSQQQIRQINAQLPQLRQQLTQIEKKIGSQVARIKTLNEKILPVEERVAALENEKKALEEEVLPLRKRRNQLTRKKQNIIKRIEQLEGKPGQEQRVARLKKKLANVSERLENVQTQLAEKEPILIRVTNQYNKKVETLKTMQNQLSKVQERLAQNQIKEKDLRQKIKPLGAKKKRLQAIVQKLKISLPKERQELVQKKTLLNQKKKQVPTLKNKIEALKTDLRVEKTALQSLLKNPTSLPAYAQDVQRLVAEIDQYQRKISRAENQLAPLEERFGKVLKRKERLEAKFQSNVLAINNLVEKLTRVQEKITNLNKAIKVAEDQLSLAQQAQVNLRAKREKARRRRKKLTNELPAFENAYNNAEALYARLSQDLARNRQELQDSVAQSTIAQRKYDKLSQRLNVVIQRIATLEDYLVSSQQDLVAYQMEHDNNVSSIALLGSQVNQLRGKKAKQEGRITNLSAELRNQEIVVNTYDNIVRNLEGKIAQNNAEIQRLGDLKVAANESMISFRETIASNIRENEEMVVELKNVKLDIAVLKTNIPRLQKIAEKTWKAFRKQDAVALEFEGVTAQKKDKYLATVELYKKQKLIAANRGQSSGLVVGKELGTEDGEEKGRSLGSFEGGQFGTDEGKLYGYKTGLGNGLDDGKKDGYSHGVNLPANYNRGHKLGYAQGEKNARAEAQRVNYPEGRAQKKRELLRRLPSRTISKDNRESAAFKSGPIVPNKEASRGHQLESVFQEGRRGVAESGLLEDEDSLRAKIARLESQLNQIAQNFQDALANAGAGLQIKPRPDYEEANCDIDYAVFKQLCLEKYAESFKKVYKKHYKSGFKSAYRVKMEEGRILSFRMHKGAREEEGYNEAYKVTFAIYDRIGAEEAESKGYQVGLQKGRDENIEDYRTEEFANGQRDEQQFFDQNAVSRLLSQSVIATTSERGFFPGARVALAMKFANFGGRSSYRGQMRVNISCPTGNAIIENRQVPITTLDGKTITAVTNVAFARISNSVQPGERITFRVTPLNANGTSMPSETVTVQAAQHIGAKIVDVVTNERPKIKSWGGYKKHTVSVTLRNNSRTRLREGFVVSLSSSNRYVELVEGVKVSSIVSEGTTTRVDLVYKFKKKSKKKVKKKRIPLTVTLKHPQVNGILGTETVVVVPR